MISRLRSLLLSIVMPLLVFGAILFWVTNAYAATYSCYFNPDGMCAGWGGTGSFDDVNSTYNVGSVGYVNALISDQTTSDIVITARLRFSLSQGGHVRAVFRQDTESPTACSEYQYVESTYAVMQWTCAVQAFMEYDAEYFVGLQRGSMGGLLRISWMEIDIVPSNVPVEAPPNEFGLSCVYTSTTGITQTVSASRVLNGSFEYYNYTNVPSGWTIQSPGSTYYATTTDAYDGDYSLQYQPNGARIFAQACRSIQIPQNTQSIAAGVMYAGGGSGTSDVTLMLDGQVLDTTTVSSSASWAALTASDTFSSTSIVHTICIEVEGANRAHIDAAWLYASETDDLLGLMCPAPEDDIVPPPPPPPPINDDDDGIPVPPPDAFGTCYRCIRPASLLQIGSWIKWLLCGIQNIFRCELFIWIENIRNLVAGLFTRMVALILWLPDAFQSGLNWGAATATNILNWAIQLWDNFRTGFTAFLRALVLGILESQFVQAVWVAMTWVSSVWQWAWGLIQGILAQVQALYFAIVNIIELGQSIIQAVAEAWVAPPYEIDFIAGVDSEGPSSLAPLEADGINDTKIYWILVTGAAVLDAVAGDFGFQYLQFIVIGVFAFGVIAWTLKQFHEIVPT